MQAGAGLEESRTKQDRPTQSGGGFGMGLRMTDDTVGSDLSGQARVYRAWRDRLDGADLLHRDRLDVSGMVAELAHVSIMCAAGDCFRFRLAGSALRQAFECDAKGLCLHDLEICHGDMAWAKAAHRALATRRPVAGRSITDDGHVHFWLRLPMSSNGVDPDMVLCHDRFIPVDEAADPEAAARAADRALRLDAVAA